MKFNLRYCKELVLVNFKLTKYELMKIMKIKNYYNDSKAACIEALKIVQKNRKWISDEAIVVISNFLGISSTELEEVATFYNRIYRQPVGKNIINYCNNLVCFVTGYKNIKNSLEKELKIISGKTTKNKKFTLLSTCCLGYCDKSPVISINNKIFTKVTPLMIPKILDLYK